MNKRKLKIGDLVQIVHFGDSTPLIPWTEGPVLGIYLGEMEFIHYKNTGDKKIDICHKVWAAGRVRYISRMDEIKLLSSVRRHSN